jgi:hypothetical protein
LRHRQFVIATQILRGDAFCDAPHKGQKGTGDTLR